MPNTSRTRLAALLVTALAILATPVVLLAHARLVRSTPAANATVAASPASLSLWFSERPELRFSSVQLVDSAGTSVALGPIASAAGDAMGITAAVPGTLMAGTYTVSWRTAAADGHSTNGKFTFRVAASAASPLTPPAQGAHDTVITHRVVPTAPVVSDSVITHHVVPPNKVLDTAAGPNMSTALRWAELVAVMTLVGAIVFRLVVLRGAELPADAAADAADRARRFASSALLLFILATITRLSAESELLTSSTGSRWNAMLSVARSTAWGHGWMVGAFGAALCIVGLAAARRSLVGWMVAGIGAIAIATSEGLTGHAAASAAHLPLSISIDLAHLLGAGSWLGGLTLVLLAGLPSLRLLPEAERSRAGSRLVRSYHTAAVDAVVIVILTACVAAWLRLGRLDALWTTTYGIRLLIKLGFVLVVLAFGLYHRRTVVTPDWGPETSFRFRRSAAGELVFGALVVAVTALLVSTALPMQ